MSAAASIAHQLGARRQGDNWRCDCPVGCGYALSFCDAADGELLAYCFGGCGFDDIIVALAEHGLLDGADDDEVVCYGASAFSKSRTAREEQRSEAARRIYDCLAPATGTIVETYLRSRRIILEVPSILRFAACPHRSRSSFPAMVAPVVDVDGNQTGIHATYLRSDGSGKADFADREFQRECRGVIRGGAIRLAEHDPDRALVVAEGVETALSAMQLFELPGWSAVSAGGLKALKLPPSVRNIIIVADNDASGTGQRSAVAAGQRWKAEGRAVRAVVPLITGDFNDVLNRGRG